MVWRVGKEFFIESKTDVEKYMKVHKSIVLGFFRFFLLDNLLIIKKNNVFTHHEGAQISLNEDKNIEQ